MPRPDYTPQLATLVKAPPSGDEWLHEIKYDGYRIGIRIRGGRATLMSRTGKDWTAAFPEVADAAAGLRADAALIDGEVAVVLADGRTSFQALQNASTGDASRSLVFFAFDLLQVDGQRLEHLPLVERKARLRRLVRSRSGRIRYSEHVQGRGDAFFAEACRLGLEGIVSKRADQPYRSGRSRDWVKTKCVLRQEFVIGGFTDPEGRRAGIGALLIGYYEDRRLVYAGKVGTGFGHAVALDLRRRLDAIERAASPFDPMPRGVGRAAHWVAPSLVCEVAFTEWTGDGKIRHPSFQGLRRDKPARLVTREQAVAVAAPAPPAAARARRGRKETTSTPVVAGVAISNAARVVYPDAGITKLDVARYYEAVADWIVPHVAGRPLTLVRCPEGIGGDCFFMKHSKVWARGPLRRVRIQEKTKVGEYLIADDLPAIVGLVQTGILEIHTWNSRDRDIERPDRLVIDLDPGEQVAWSDVVRAGRLVRRALSALDLESFPKTTGGRGLHVVVPLVPHADWSECLAFARAVCEALERADPDLFTTQFAKAGRSRQILLDYLRNNRTNTSIAAYSTRARAGATVSVPLTWAELRPGLDPQRFTIHTVRQRARRLAADPWRDYWSCRQKLTAQRLRAVLGRIDR